MFEVVIHVDDVFRGRFFDEEEEAYNLYDELVELITFTEGRAVVVVRNVEEGLLDTSEIGFEESLDTEE